MDFGALLAEYGLPGAAIFALGWFCVRLMAENKALYDVLIDRKEDDLRASIRREEDVQALLRAILEAVRAR